MDNISAEQAISLISKGNLEADSKKKRALTKAEFCIEHNVN